MGLLQERLKHRRESLKLTLLEVAEYIGVTEATIQRYESGVIKNVPHETIVKLAEILHTSPAYLMGWEEAAKKMSEAASENAQKISKAASRFDGQKSSEAHKNAKQQIEEINEMLGMSTVGEVQKIYSFVESSFKGLETTQKTSDEEQLSTIFSECNKEGQQLILNLADTIANNPNYKKSYPDGHLEKGA